MLSIFKLDNCLLASTQYYLAPKSKLTYIWSAQQMEEFRSVYDITPRELQNKYIITHVLIIVIWDIL